MWGSDVQKDKQGGRARRRVQRGGNGPGRGCAGTELGMVCGCGPVTWGWGPRQPGLLSGVQYIEAQAVG